MRNRIPVVIVFGLGATDQLAQDTVASLEMARTWFDDGSAEIWFTGGIFNAAGGQTQPLAKMMADWWENHRTYAAQTYLEEGSVTTRENVTNTTEMIRKRRLGQRPISDFDVTVVSEFWHCVGIRLLFLVLYRKWVRIVPSLWKLSRRDTIMRILRLPLYIIDPRGRLPISQRETKKRRKTT